jgi:hypothetical protein
MGNSFKSKALRMVEAGATIKPHNHNIPNLSQIDIMPVSSST